MNEPALQADLSGVPKAGQVIIGLSAGADSMALTHYMLDHTDKNRIHCVHVNHMLRGAEADRDEAAAAAFCSGRGLRFTLFREDVRTIAKEKGMGEEECGRMLRYRAFRSLVTGENDRILTAHNANDNAETLLFHLAKGAGLSGLCGIPRQRENILRPLLSATRAEIEAYCAFYGLPYVQDSSNFETDYERNRIRRQVVPVLEGINPRFVEAVTGLTQALRADRDYIAGRAQALLEQAAVPGGLAAAVLAAAHESVRTAALKQFFEEKGCGRLSREHIVRAAENLQGGFRLRLPGNYEYACSCGVVSVQPVAEKAEKTNWCMPVETGENLLPCGKMLTLHVVDACKIVDGIKFNNLLFKNSLDYDTITKALYAGNRRGGDVFSPAGRHHTKTLKKLLLEMRIPANRRADTVLLRMQEKILFVEGAGPAEGFQVTRQSKRALMVEIADKKP